MTHIKMCLSLHSTQLLNFKQTLEIPSITLKCAVKMMRFQHRLVECSGQTKQEKRKLDCEQTHSSSIKVQEFSEILATYSLPSGHGGSILLWIFLLLLCLSFPHDAKEITSNYAMLMIIVCSVQFFVLMVLPLWLFLRSNY